MTRPYRDDLDWLRAIAVLSVLAFHWDVPPFRGGYVGVDIFFVISGFLITQIIQAETRTGTFSFARFYERRVRRLLPALYAMVALVVPPAFLYLLPAERHEFFRSIAAVVTFTSNIFFWLQTGYFTHAAEEKPLLHTWSLAVEEQFYLVLPLLAWGLLRLAGPRRPGAVLFAGLGIAALASFAFSHWLMTHGHAAAAFFTSLPRAWEFLLGALITVEGMPAPGNVHLRRIARGAGLALIAGAAVGYRDGTAFPGLAALLPCAGAALFIWSGIGSGTVDRAPWSPLAITGFFGRISYSLYLWHWPLFIYARFTKANLTLGAPEKAALFALAVALSYASYRFVEQPLRRGALVPTRRLAFATAGCATLVLLLASAWGVSTGGAAPDRRAAELEAYDRYAYQEVYRFGTCFVGDWRDYDDRACLTPEAGKRNVLLWGDSLAAHYVHGLAAAVDPARVNILQATAESCFPSLEILPRFVPLCRSLTRRVAAFVASSRPDLVIVSADWVGYARGMGFDAMIGDLRRSLAELARRGIPVLVVGPSVQFRSRLPPMLLRAAARSGAPPPPADLVIPEVFARDAQMKAALSDAEGVTYVSIADALCPERTCPVTVAAGIPLAWDHAHLTAEGSVYAAGPIARAARLARADSVEVAR